MMEQERERVIQFMRELDDSVCDRRERFPGGFATLSDEELPRVPDMNVLRIETLPERLSARELAAEAARLASEAERLQGMLRFRRVVAYDEELGTRLALGFEQLDGWRSERVVLMALHRPPDRQADLGLVREVGIEELELARGRFFRERGDDAERVRQELLAVRRLGELGELSRFAVVVDGEIASWCDLYSDGSCAAVIRGVATLNGYRGNGFARATVSRALARSRALQHDLTFLRAVHADWPKNLYGKLGFDAIGIMYRFGAVVAGADAESELESVS
ncbi:MAG: GNAT family N-acetyltransferase [Gaiellaceae bacterium]